MDFLNLEFDLPDPQDFCRLVAEMHQNSVSPTGMFGFDLPTCHGKNIQPNNWTPSWISCFTEVLSAFYDEDMKANGSWPAYEQAFDILRSEVIPKILDPLQADGRELKPCLAHGDLWEGNTGIDVETGSPVVFDASCMYAHNEYDLGMWRRELVGFAQPYFSQYRMRIPPSEPVDQWDDRNRLYSIKFNLSHSSHFPRVTTSRDQ
ncbi:hypothetical protein PspLS_05201 [Pyricularia sp. CBS 133598]|nr:hypothetical protein PspLS_05201 [Pyricularia sp. CBS 133598]